MGHLWTAAPGCSSILRELGVVCYREGPCLFSGGRELEETMQGWALVLDWETERVWRLEERGRSWTMGSQTLPMVT